MIILPRDHHIPTHPLVIYDGHCLLCSKAIQFILKHETGERLKFTTLKSKITQSIITQLGIKEVPDSILFYYQGILYAESNAVIQIAEYLKRPYSSARMVRFLPLQIRDVLYQFISRNRYKWFGRSDEICAIIEPDTEHRFIT